MSEDNFLEDCLVSRENFGNAAGFVAGVTAATGTLATAGAEATAAIHFPLAAPVLVPAALVTGFKSVVSYEKAFLEAKPIAEHLWNDIAHCGEIAKHLFHGVEEKIEDTWHDTTMPNHPADIQPDLGCAQMDGSHPSSYDYVTDNTPIVLDQDLTLSFS